MTTATTDITAKLNPENAILREAHLEDISSFAHAIDMSEMDIDSTGKPTARQVMQILSSINRLHSDTALILPENYLYRIDEKTIMKNAEQISLRRYTTKKKAIEDKLTPLMLLSEKMAELNREYKVDDNFITKDFAAINFKGITDKKTKH